MMNDSWLKDVMSQKFLNSDLTRILMLKAFVKAGEILGAYKKIDILEYIYREYADYEELRRINPDARVRSINRYGISDMKYILENALGEWKNDAQNGTLVCDERYIYIKDVGTHGIELGRFTIQLSNMLLKKYFSVEVIPPKEVSVEECFADTDLERFGKGIFRNRVFEDMQYCPLCEEVQTEELRVVHILPAKYCKKDIEITDKANGLIMCKTHAKEYMSGLFWFKENGFVVNNGSKSVLTTMHLSIGIKNRKRRQYLARVEKLKEDGEA